MKKYKQQLDALELQPSSGGCFELTIDDQLVYSKLSTGSFPDEEHIVEEVGRRLWQCQTELRANDYGERRA